MKIVTFNTWGNYGPPNRKPVLLNSLKAVEADILCLQEVTDPVWLDQLDYPTRFHSSIGTLGLISQFKALDHKKITFKTRSPLEAYARGALAVQLQLEGFPLWVITTHLSWQAEDDASRLGQMEELIQWSEQFPDPVLLTGDLNATASTNPVGQLLQSGFQDLFVQHQPEAPGITWDNANPFIRSHSSQFPDRRIDYLFLRQRQRTRLDLAESAVVLNQPTSEGILPSDHYGVSATLFSSDGD